MSCQCIGIEELFNQELAERELEAYRKKGPARTTRMMVEALKREGVEGLTLLDIGGGIGAVQHGLLEAGVERAVDVDASPAYLKAARAEAARRGLAERVRFQRGNFVELSAARAEKLYAVVYPRDSALNRLGVFLMNAFLRLRGSPFRSYVHPTRAVEALVERHGLRRRYHRRTLIWQVAVFAR